MYKKNMNPYMEGRHSRLNPFARPFYPPSTVVYHRHFITPFHHPPHDHEAVVVPGRPLHHPHTTKSSFLRRSSSHTPVPTGPRNRLHGRKTAAVGGGTRDNINNGCRVIRLKKRQETMPLDPNDKSTTSVMIRNIPNNYTRRLLVEFLEEHCKNENEKEENTTTTVRSAFDFVYLPVDFKHRLNAGYAFVNFTTSEAAWNFHKSVTGKPWKLFQSKKIADVTRAKIQGKEAMTRNFERMKLRSPSQEYLPVWFEPPRDGCVRSPSSQMHTIGDVLAS